GPPVSRMCRPRLWWCPQSRRSCGVPEKSCGYYHDMSTLEQHRSPLAWAVLAAAVLQGVAPAVTFNGPGESPGEGSGPDLLITPAGWAFSIWGVIYALAIVQAIAMLVARSARATSRQQVAQVVLYLGASLWIVMAALGSSVA